jgi:GMP synthase-like glutamine amidotransferase
MEIGIVSLYPKLKNIQNLENAIKILGYKPHIIDLAHTTPDKIYYYIKNSWIKHWLFSGSPTSVIDRGSPQIPMELFRLAAKRYMFICYSLESVMFQLKYPISFRKELKKELFDLDVSKTKINNTNTEYLFKSINFPMKVWRNHYGFVSDTIINSNLIEEVTSYEGECMILLYRNSILVQYHPERTKDGLKLIDNWIRHSN